jgi:uncharacterized membrane protein
MKELILAYLLIGVGFALYGTASSLQELFANPIRSIIQIVLGILFYPFVVLSWVLEALLLV